MATRMSPAHKLLPLRYCLAILAILVPVLVGSASASANTFTGNIFTVAGNGPVGVDTGGFAGDNGPADQAIANEPGKLAALPEGGFLFADQLNYRIRRVAPDGTITTVAGTGVAGFAGDNGPANAAQLGYPSGLAVLPDGSYLIADNENSRIRRVAPDGTITTVAGTGVAGFAGDNGPANAAQLNFPRGIAALPDGSYLIADSGNGRIRRVAPDGTITTVAGTGVYAPLFGDGGPAYLATLETPSAIAVHPDGGYLIVETGTNRIRRVDSAGMITTVAGSGPANEEQGDFGGDGGPAVEARLASVSDVAVLPDGGYLISDSGNDRIRRVAPDGTITTVAGTGVAGFAGDNGPANAAQLNGAGGIAVSTDGRLLIADLFSNRIRLVDIDLRARPATLRNPLNPNNVLDLGEIATLSGNGILGYSGDTTFASQAQLSNPRGVSVMPERPLRLAGLPAGHDTTEEGSIFIADTSNNRIRKITPDGRIWTVAGNHNRGYMVRDANGDLRAGDGLPATQAELNNPSDVDALADGSFFIADTGNNLIRRVNTKGIIKTVAGQVRRDGNGDVSGKGIAGYDGDNQAATNARLDSPQGVSATSKRDFLIADFANHIVRRVLDRQIETVAGVPNDPSVLYQPERAIRLRNGDLLISSASHVIYRAKGTSGRLTVVAGSGLGEKTVTGEGRVFTVPDPGYRGDNNSRADRARLSFPAGLIETINGGFIFADSFNDRIRRVSRPSRRTVPFLGINTIAGDGGNGLRRNTQDFGRATNASLDRPNDIARHPDGLIIADTNNNAIRFVRGDF